MFEREPEAASPLMPEGTGGTRHGKHALRRFHHHPKTMEKSTCHSSGPPFQVSTEPCATAPEETAPRGEPSPTRRWGAVRGSGLSPASWRMTGLGPDRHRSIERAALGLKDRVPSTTRRSTKPARAPGARLVPRSLPEGRAPHEATRCVAATGSLVPWRAEARPGRIEPKLSALSLPGAPKRPESPEPVKLAGR